MLAPRGIPARAATAPEERMATRFGRGRDPFWDDGQGARRRNLVQRTEARLALVLAIVACGLTTAMWLRQFILPLAGIGD